MPSPRKLILYIAMSLDGYIAKLDDSLDFLSVVENEGENYGYANFMDSIDTVIIGRRTYDKVISIGITSPHGNKKTYVITHTPKPQIGNTIFYNGELKTLVNSLKAEHGLDIYCDGGAQVVTELLKDNLIDEFYISIIPVLLGDGIKLFQSNSNESTLRFISSKSYEKGLVQLHYSKI
jgi:dihydrofolate reductase